MLNIYRSRESLDKESFIYGKIKESRKETLVIVPDQYTLVAEQISIIEKVAKRLSMFKSMMF